MDAAEIIRSGNACLGIEFGSTRIKALLVAPDGTPLAQGAHEWENRLADGYWTYSLNEIHSGLQACYADLRGNVAAKYGMEIERLGAIGISAMMHGYMPFDAKGRMLAEFRTWRNTNTAVAAAKLSKLFNFNIPLRWSVSHLYQAIIDNEPHVPEIDFITTLAGYVHWQLTGEKVLGVGDASGMFPIDSRTKEYNTAMLRLFDDLTSMKGFSKPALSVLPKIICAGHPAGALTPEGAALLDPTGHLQPGIPFCPPEGDAGTGMVATNSVKPRTGNVSAGTSSFSMIVTEKELSQPYESIDMVTTPDGHPVAMVHCNNCTSDLNAWAGLFKEFATLLGVNPDMGEIFTRLYTHALGGDADCGGLVSYNYFSGEPVMGFAEGRPLLVRSVNDTFNLANFVRANLHAAVAVLKVGNDILFNQEHVKVDRLTGHGGLFKTPEAGQRILSAALGTPITVMSTAGEGGAWGMALLASYLVNNPEAADLPSWLESKVFAANTGSTTLCATPAEIAGFERYMANYLACLPVETAAIAAKA